jgi:hypothetical protein
MRICQAIVFVVLAQGLAGCSHSPAPITPLTPTPIPQPSPPFTGTQLAGTVYDSAFRPLAGARVEVVDGPQAGASTVADASGHYALAGDFDDATRFRATKDGYLGGTGTRQPFCQPCHPNWWLYFYLAPVAPPVDIAGDYTLTLRADAACANLPNEARTRTYAARITRATDPAHPANTQFDVTVGGSSFLDGYRVFGIFVAGDYLSAEIGNAHGSPGLVEEIGAKTYLTLGGSVAASVTDVSTISASFNGFVERCELTTEWGSRYNCSEAQTVALAQCTSTKHQLILTRR